MLRFVSIWLVFSFFLGTLGLKVNQHFCCGKLVSFELLLGQNAHDCSGKVSKQKNKCCKDKVQSIQVDDAKQSLNHFLCESISFIGFTLHSGFIFTLNEVSHKLQAVNSIFINGPPLCHKSVSIFILFRKIII